MEKEKTAKNGSVHANHRKRVRARFLESGLNGMEDHQVLELLLFYAIPRCDTNPIAHHLLDEFGSLPNVFNAPIEALAGIPGIGTDSAILLKLLPAVWSRCRLSASAASDFITNREELESSLSPLLTDPVFEQFACALVDGRGRVLKKFIADTGGVRSVHADVESIVREAVINRAAGVAVAHSHPTGYAAPSFDDVQATVALAEQLGHLNIRLLDHMILAPDGALFLSEYGKVPPGVLAFSFQ